MNKIKEIAPITAETEMPMRRHSHQICISLFFLLASLISVLQVQAQGFESGLVFGVNLSQLDGDNLQGFDKLGLHLGIKTTYQLSKSSGLSIELLYQQKGSSTTINFSRPSNQQHISLHYLSVPVLYQLNEWYDDTIDDHRIRIDGGIVSNRLFSASSSNSFFDNDSDSFASFDIGALIGISYFFSRHWGLTIRYERSFLKIFQNPTQDIRGLQSYLLNIRTEYRF